MKKRKIWLLGAVIAVLAAGLVGCRGKSRAADVSSVQTTAESAALPSEDTGAASAPTQEEGLRIFTDSAGRQVEIPKDVRKIAPSGPLAQIVLYTVCPDKLAGLASDFSEDAKSVIDEKYWGLPKFGQFYGKNASLNMEALIAEAPDIIVDIGEAKKTVKEDMDALQKQLGIPVVFVEATLPTMEQAYTMLGELTGEEEQAQALASYCKNTLQEADRIAASIPESDRTGIYFALGDDGLHTNARGSIHADVIDKIGAVNVADVEAVSSGGGSEVSLEQVILWQPDMIIADTQALYDTILSDKAWAEVKAVSEGRVYKIPTVPYSFMSSPPSVNRIIGIQWLASLTYPDQYAVDIRDEVREFYKLFYHIDVTDKQLEKIL